VDGVEHLNERFVEYQQWPNHLLSSRKAPQMSATLFSSLFLPEPIPDWRSEPSWRPTSPGKAVTTAEEGAIAACLALIHLKKSSDNTRHQKRDDDEHKSH